MGNVPVIIGGISHPLTLTAEKVVMRAALWLQLLGVQIYKKVFSVGFVFCVFKLQMNMDTK